MSAMRNSMLESANDANSKRDPSPMARRSPLARELTAAARREVSRGSQPNYAEKKVDFSLDQSNINSPSEMSPHNGPVST